MEKQRKTRQPGVPVDQERVAPAERNRRQWMVISYDSPNDKRRTKMLKALEGFGKRVQYSVFECEVRPSDVPRLHERLEKLLQQDEDDIRLYPLCENCLRKVRMLGKAKAHTAEAYVVV
jgi:CRISPR-associated protein Cas2